MVEQQPMKMAAAELLWESEDPAALSIFTTADLEARKNIIDIRIPGALSFLSYDKFSGEVKGMNDIQAEYEAIYGPGDYTPPVMLSYWSFRIMVGAGFLMLFITLLGLWMWKFKKLQLKSNLWLGITAAILLPYIANTAGWLLTEMGRQPWVVYGLLLTADAVSPNISVAQVMTSLLGFTVIYGILLVVDVYLLVKFAKAGPQVDHLPETQKSETVTA
jgi:cytochrome d ubiquinol oxidase subunit I